MTEGDFDRRNAVSNNHRPTQNRYRSALEPSKKKDKSPSTCSFYDVEGHTMRGSECPPLRLWREFLCIDTLADSYKTGRLGCTSSHHLEVCPPTSEASIKAQERPENPDPILPWPQDGKHMILHRAFFDCNVPHHESRFGSNLTKGNSHSNIIEVSYLTTPGADLYVWEGKSVFYYRVEYLAKIIANKIRPSNKRKLISKLKSCRT